MTALARMFDSPDSRWVHDELLDYAEGINKASLCCISDEHILANEFLSEADEIFKALKVDVYKALDPLDQVDFLKLEARAVRSIQKAFKDLTKQENEYLKQLISRIDPEVPATIEEFVNFSKITLDSLPGKAASKLSPILTDIVLEMYMATRASKINDLFNKEILTTKGKINRFGTRDEQVVEMMNRNNRIFINEGVRATIDRFEVRSKKILSNALEQGVPRKQLAKQMNVAFGSTVNNEHYWNIVGSSYVNRSRNWANLEVFNELDIEEYEILAVLDERTSSVCRAMNGKRFSVQKQIKMLERATEAESLDEFTKKVPWLSTKKKEDGIIEVGIRRPRSFVTVLSGKTLESAQFVKPVKDLQGLGFGLPPFHGLCRTTVIEVV